MDETGVKEFISDAYEPSDHDFGKMEDLVDEWKAIFEKYEPIRNKVFAHNDLKVDINALFEATNISELVQLMERLQEFHQALSQMFHNGRKPLPLPNESSGLKERVKEDTEKLLRSIDKSGN